MTRLDRWLRFSLVGALGSAVQLGALALIHRAAAAHYLADSAAALELTLLHNFAWHLRFTWRDRRQASRAQQLVRFHLTNGLASLAGNLALMRIFVGLAHMPVLLANVIAIGCCSVLNFALANGWVFRPATR